MGSASRDHSATPHRTIALVCLASGMDYMAVGMMRTLLPYYADALTNGIGTATLIGSLETCYGIGQVVGGSFIGRLSDFRGRRSVLMLSILGAAVGYMLSGYAAHIGSPALLLVSRFPVGLAKQTATVSRSIVADITADSPSTRSFFMSLLAASFGFGYSLGPYLGGQVASIFGETSPAVAASIVFLGVLMPVIYWFLPETRPPSEKSDTAIPTSLPLSWGSAMAPLLSNRRLARVISFLAIPEVCLIMHSTTSVSAFAISSGVDKASLGFANSLTAGLAAVCSAFCLPFLVTRKGWSDVALLRLGQIAFVFVAVTILAGSNEFHHFISPRKAIVWASIPMSVVASTLRAVPPALVSKQVTSEVQGGAMGVLDLMSSTCRVFAPLLCGWLMDHVGSTSPFIFQASMCIFGIFFINVIIGPEGGNGERGNGSSKVD